MRNNHLEHTDHLIRVTNFAGFGESAYNIAPRRRRPAPAKRWKLTRSSFYRHQTASVLVVGVAALMAIGGLTALTHVGSTSAPKPAVVPALIQPATPTASTKGG